MKLANYNTIYLWPFLLNEVYDVISDIALYNNLIFSCDSATTREVLSKGL